MFGLGPSELVLLAIVCIGLPVTAIIVFSVLLAKKKP